MADVGRHSKKALLVISDGNDTNSRISVDELRSLIRESEVLVYALGVDGTTTQLRNGPTIQLPVPLPFPILADAVGAVSRLSSAGAGARLQPSA